GAASAEESPDKRTRRASEREDVMTVDKAEGVRRGRLAIGDAELVVPLAEGVLVADQALAIHTANEAAADLLGWGDPSELVRAASEAAWGLFEHGQVSEVVDALARTGR